MARNEYRFVTRWRLEAPREEVFSILTDSKSLARWWPSVYRRVDQIAPPRGDDGVGKELHLLTQGWLPYRLRWGLRVIEYDPPSRLAFEASGDFVGSGRWTLADQGDATVVEYEWNVQANKPILRSLSPVLRPVFALNHRWAMARGLESIELEIERRRGGSVPLPPEPVSALRSGLVLIAALVALGGALVAVLR